MFGLIFLFCFDLEKDNLFGAKMKGVICKDLTWMCIIYTLSVIDDNKEMTLFLIPDNPRAIEVLLSKGAQVDV